MWEPILQFARSSAVMRCVKIVEHPNETYSFAAIDQATGEVPLRLADRTALVVLCGPLAIQDDTQAASLRLSSDLPPQRMGERHRGRRSGKPARRRLGGATKYTRAGGLDHHRATGPSTIEPANRQKLQTSPIRHQSSGKIEHDATAHEPSAANPKPTVVCIAFVVPLSALMTIRR